MISRLALSLLSVATVLTSVSCLPAEAADTPAVTWCCPPDTWDYTSQYDILKVCYTKASFVECLYNKTTGALYVAKPECATQATDCADYSSTRK